MHSFDRLKLALIKTAKKKKTILPRSGKAMESEVRRTAKGGPGVRFIEDVPGQQSKGRGPGEGASSAKAKAIVRTADRANIDLGKTFDEFAAGKKPSAKPAKMLYHGGR